VGWILSSPEKGAPVSDYHAWTESWMRRDDLPCQKMPEWWEPEGWTDSAVKVRRARRGCAGCPVRAECLEWALTARFTYVLGDLAVHHHRVADSRAILAGTTPAERRAVAHLPLLEQIDQLNDRLYHHVVRGPFATMKEEEVA
jgi:hypothetical protein